MIVAESIKELESWLKSGRVHLLLIDIDFKEKGKVQGVGLISLVRALSRVPVIVVSASETEQSTITALNAGADDYVTVACNPLELLARVKSQVRRYTQLVNVCENIDRIYKVDGLVIDDIRRKVSVDGREVRLTPIEY